MSGLFAKEMTLVHRIPAAADATGRPAYTTSVSTVYGAYRHRQAVDRLDAGLVVIDEWTAYLQPDATVAVGDTVIVDGSTFEVVSAPFPAFNHRIGAVHHQEVRLRKAVR